MKFISTLFLSISFCTVINASDNSFYKQKYRGWFWFEDKDKKTLKTDKELDLKQNLSPLEQIENQKKELEEKKAEMIISPSIENAKNYMEAQSKIFKSADKVSKAWQAALIKYPYLNSLIENPVNQHAINYKREITKDIEINEIKEFSKNYGFIFFFRSDCRYCHEFSKVLAEFTKDFDISVEAISVDGGEIDNFNSRKDEYLSNKFNIQIFPSVIAYSPNQNKAFPVSNGYLSYDELLKHLTFTIKLLKGNGKL